MWVWTKTFALLSGNWQYCGCLITVTPFRWSQLGHLLQSLPWPLGETIRVKEGLSGLGLLLVGKKWVMRPHKGAAQAVLTGITTLWSPLLCGHWKPWLLPKHSRRQTGAVDEILALASDTRWWRLTACIPWLDQSGTFRGAQYCWAGQQWKPFPPYKPGADNVIY